MKTHSEEEWKALQTEVMGLGERSCRKSYYPELQERLDELERFKALLDQARDIIFLVRVPEGGLADVSQSACRLLGYPREELMALSIFDLLSPDAASVLKACLSEAKACVEGERVFATYLAGKNGGRLPVEIRVAVVPFRDSVFAVAVARDTTERMQAEKILKESEEKYRALVESSPDAILMLDEERKILSSNDAFLRLSGFSRYEVEGKSARVVHPSDESFTSFGALALNALESSESFRIEWELRRKDGTLIPVEVTISSLKAQESIGRRYVAILRDISRRKKAEADLGKYREHLEDMVLERTRQLETAQKALIRKEKLKTLGELSAEIAHEIRNPLMSIGGFARRLQAKAPDLVEPGIIVKESHRLEKLLDRITRYLKPVEIRPGDCSVNAALKECLEFLSPELNRAHVAYRLDLAPELPCAYVDPGILTQLLTTLIRSTLKRMDGKQALIIKTFEEDQSIRLELRSPVPDSKTEAPGLLSLDFDESREEGEMPISLRVIEDMGGTLSFAREADTTVVSLSLPKSPVGSAPDA